MERSVNTAMPRVTTEDLRLIDSTLAGQSEAFGALVEKYQDRLYHSMLRLTGLPEDARDVGQDAFVQAFTMCFFLIDFLSLCTLRCDAMHANTYVYSISKVV